jgi:hypothetical protein
MPLARGEAGARWVPMVTSAIPSFAGWACRLTKNLAGCRDFLCYSYSRFCELYRAFETRLPVTMQQTHAVGERLFVDYAGDGVPVVAGRLTGEIRKPQIFVAVRGASSLT